MSGVDLQEEVMVSLQKSGNVSFSHHLPLINSFISSSSTSGCMPLVKSPNFSKSNYLSMARGL